MVDLFSRIPVRCCSPFLVSALLFCGSAAAQGNSAWKLGVSLNFPRIMVYSVSYYPNDNSFIEFSMGGVPHYVNIGLAYNYLDRAQQPRFLYRIGVLNLSSGGYRPHNLHDLPADSLIQVGGSVTALEVGIGRQFVAGDRTWYFSAGPNFVFRETASYYTKNDGYFSRSAPISYRIYPVIDVGAYLNKDD